MEPEEIFINLKVLQGLNKNQKLISRGQYINVEPQSIIPEGLRRWRRQDSRDETLKKINLIVNSAIEYILKDSNSTSTAKIRFNEKTTLLNGDNENALVKKEKSGHEMKIYLENALHGIKNLKETYATCSQTCARIDVVVNKIEHVLAGATKL